jgi:hypothetical protein
VNAGNIRLGGFQSILPRSRPKVHDEQISGELHRVGKESDWWFKMNRAVGHRSEMAWHRPVQRLSALPSQEQKLG